MNPAESSLPSPWSAPRAAVSLGRRVGWLSPRRTRRDPSAALSAPPPAPPSPDDEDLDFLRRLREAGL